MLEEKRVRVRVSIHVWVRVGLEVKIVRRMHKRRKKGWLIHMD